MAGGPSVWVRENNQFARTTSPQPRRRAAAHQATPALPSSKSPNDQQAEQSAIAALTRDASFDSDLSSISSDVKKTAADLAQTRADAQAGGGDNCVNASSTVYNDAASAVYNDAQSSLYNDLNTLTRDDQSVQKDIATVQSADQQLASDGLPASPGAASAIDAAQGATATAKTAANGDIDMVNKDVSTAYAVANSIATGPCAGTGPGNPPTPIPHI